MSLRVITSRIVSKLEKWWGTADFIAPNSTQTQSLRNIFTKEGNNAAEVAKEMVNRLAEHPNRALTMDGFVSTVLLIMDEDIEQLKSKKQSK